MGYILPIQHITYSDYQQRIKPAKLNHYNIYGPYPVMNNDLHSDLSEEFSLDNQAFTKLSDLPLSKIGKGQYINTYV